MYWFEDRLKTSWVDDWRSLAIRLSMNGELRETRAGLTREFVCFSDKFVNPHFTTVAGRGGSSEFARIEQLSYIAGVDSEILASHFPSFNRYKSPQYGWWGSYGPRLHQPLKFVVHELATHPESRRAVATIFTTIDTEIARVKPDTDIPCTLALNFWLKSDMLMCHAIMRSTDIWFGLYYDIPAFHAIQHVIAHALQVECGPLYFTTSSMHIYQDHWTRALELHTDPTSLVMPEFTDLYAMADEVQETAVGRLLVMQAGANNILQKFYKSGAPLEEGRATIGNVREPT